MRKTLKSGLQVNPLGRCADSFCPEHAAVVVTFQSRYSTAPENPVGYCAHHVDVRFVDDDTYDKRHWVGRSHVFPRSSYEIREPNEVESAELAWERGAEERWRAEGRVGEYRRIAELHAAADVDGVFVDGWTAAACVALHDNLSERNRARWLDMPTTMQCHVAIELTMGGK
ncbi:hypothetical protein AB0L75_16340 [Streptomyces sp. NPDC052101]|uniref:hypothetical protein n=1 Tax=Streptomyces sp. NPDC052101 TaxID=3155763 RepID=UPI00342BCFA0